MRRDMVVYFTRTIQQGDLQGGVQVPTGGTVRESRERPNR